VTEDEFAELEAGNPAFELLERVAIVREKATGQVAIAVLHKMPDGSVNDDGESVNWRNVCYRLEPGAWEGIVQALEDPALLRQRIAEARAVIEGLGKMEPQGRA
jgi:hypothetical protein